MTSTLLVLNFWTRFFIPEIFGPKICLNTNFLNSDFFDPNIFDLQFYLDPKFSWILFGQTSFLGLKILVGLNQTWKKAQTRGHCLRKCLRIAEIFWLWKIDYSYFDIKLINWENFFLTIRPAYKISVLYLQNQASYSNFLLANVMRNLNFKKKI